MLLNQGDHVNCDNENYTVSSAKEVLMDNMVKMYNGLIKQPEQHALITKQEIMSVYTIRDF